MKNNVPIGFHVLPLYALTLILLLLVVPVSTFASHIIGGELTYNWVSGNTYQVTLVLYGDCGSTSGAFQTMPAATPNICIFDGDTSVPAASLVPAANPLILSLPSPSCGTETTPLCGSSVSQCTSLSSPILGIMKFVHTGTVTLPYASDTWRFVYTSDNGSTISSHTCPGTLGTGTTAPASSGRTSSITNIVSGSSIQLIDTLNNSAGHNSSALFRINPAPFYAFGVADNYYPDAVDPDGDSLTFALVDAGAGTGGCGAPGGSVAYLFPYSGANPLAVLTSLVFNPSNGLLSFTPNIVQRSTVVYNTREFRGGILVGTSMREMNFLVAVAGSPTTGTPCVGIPGGGTVSIGTGCSGAPDTLLVNNGFPGCGINYQWQTSPDGITWTNISGGTTPAFPYTPTGSFFYRCEDSCTFSGLTNYSAPVYIPLSNQGIMHDVVSTPTDTFCNGPMINVTACGTTPGYNVTTYYGDATSDNTLLTTTPVFNATITHTYAAPGSYYIYQVLYNGTTPIDTMGFTYEYLYCRTLPVKFYFDANSDCFFDAGDSPMYLPILTEVDSDGVAIDTLSATSGFYYKAYGPAGTIYSFRPFSGPGGMYFSCPSAPVLYDTITAAVTDYPVRYFALNCSASSSFDLAEYAGFRAGPDYAGAIVIAANNYCTPESATVTMQYSPLYTFASAYPAPVSVAGNVITWNAGVLKATTPPGVFNASFIRTSGSPIPVGDTVHTSYLVSPTSGDIDPANNSSARIDTVLASWDPNKMTVFPSGILPYSPDPIALLYTIYFENTGNAPAHDIYIMDTLSAFINLKTLKVVAASAAMNLAVFNDGTHNIAKFDFPNINLPDSAYHNQCNGMVQFSVSSVAGVRYEGEIMNHAGIFFDDNPAVQTNWVDDINGHEAGVATVARPGGDIYSYPNPTDGTLYVLMGSGGYNSLTITNTLGQVVMKSAIQGHTTVLDIKKLPAGVYYVTYFGGNGNKVERIVKM